MDSQLLALEQIGKKRYEAAQSAVYHAIANQDAANKALEQAQFTLDDYQKKLPELIAALYLHVIGSLTDAPSIGELLQKEQKLTLKTTQFKEELAKCQTTLELSKAATDKAYAQLAVQERKKTALAQLRQELAKERGIKEARSLAKVMDEFAGYRYISKHS